MKHAKLHSFINLWSIRSAEWDYQSNVRNLVSSMQGLNGTPLQLGYVYKHIIINLELSNTVILLGILSRACLTPLPESRRLAYESKIAL
jgi:hypothetical protein